MRYFHIIDQWLRQRPARIYIGSLLLSVLPVALFLLTAHQVLMKQITVRSKSQIQRSSANIAFLLDEHLANSLALLNSFASRSEVMKATEGGDAAELHARLTESLPATQRFRFLAVVSPGGRVATVSPAGDVRVGEDLSSRQWFEEVLRHQKPYVSRAHRLSDQALAITIAQPLFTRGKFIGVLIGEETVEAATHSVFQLLTQNADAVLFIDHSGQGMARRQGTSLTLQDLAPEVKNRVQNAPTGDADLVTIDGEQYLVAYSPVPSAGWGAAIQLPMRTIRSAVWVYEKSLAVLGGVFVIVAFGFGTFVASLYKELRDREQQNHAIIEGGQEAFFMLDHNGLVTEWNPEAESTFCRTRVQMLGRSAMELFCPEGQQLLARFMQRAQSSECSVIMEKRLESSALRPDGTRMEVEISLGSLALRKERVFTAFVRDISERKAHLDRIARQQQELSERNHEIEHANRMKSQFLASMSHDLRTPLNSILGFSELLAEQSIGTLNEKQGRFIEHIRNSGRHLLDLINDVLDLSKIEAGQLQLARAPVALRAALDQVQGDIQPQLRAKRLSFAVQAPDLEVLADPTRLRQVLLNLLGNAVKFTPDGGQVRIETSVTGQMVAISVIDNGIGIAPEHQQSIFEEFQQVGTSTKGIMEGTGLGLAIVKRLVLQHGGSITLKSAPGEGSCFTFTLPLVTSAIAVPKREAASNEETPLILVVDDEAIAQELLVRYLAADGYRTAVAGSARETFEQVRKQPPDAITLDIMMSGTSGWEILHVLKSDPATAQIPVIVVSIVDERQMGVLLGADEYFVKPVDRMALLRALERVLGSSSRKNRSCLVVDDDPLARTLMLEVVRSLGCRELQAESGEHAIELLERDTPDAVILDLIMPGMHGIQVMEWMRSVPRLSKVPVIILTAKDVTVADSTAIQQHAQAFLRKAPDWQRQLSASLRNVFQNTAVAQAGEP